MNTSCIYSLRGMPIICLRFKRKKLLSLRIDICFFCHNIGKINIFSRPVFRLGNGKKDAAQGAVRVALDNPPRAVIKGVACGGRHTFIWLDNGKLFCFGNNFFAQLGYDFDVATYKNNQVWVGSCYNSLTNV